MALRKLCVVIAASLGVVVCAMAFSSGSALAAFTHNYEFSFGPLSGVGGLAVDDSTGDVYVGAGESIYKFNAAGQAANFTATSTNVLEAVGGIQQLAVDNSSGPAKGDLYAAVSGSVRIYSAAGELIGELTSSLTSEVPGAPWGNACGVSVDANGRVYVAGNYRNVEQFAPSTNPVKNTDYVSALFGLGGVCNLAANNSGGVYASIVGEGDVKLFDAAQFNTGGLAAEPSATFPGSFSVSDAVAIDPSTDYAYYDRGSDVLILDATATAHEKIKPASESPGAFGGSNAIAVNGTTHEIYVADGEHSRINVFSGPLVVPDSTTDAPGLTQTTVTLKGTVNPDGLPATCVFEYGTSNSYGQSVPCAAAPGSGSSPVQANAEISGLEPAVLYHYRIVATNANGTTVGEDRTFALPYKPVVGEEWSTGIALSTAIVEGDVNPMSYETGIHVEYGTTTAYGANTPVPDAAIGSGAGLQTVRQRLTGLQPGTTYHYRLVATNANGETDGADRTFTTFAAAGGGEQEACPNAAFRTGFSAALPDCRAYEMVTPAEKSGSEVYAAFPHMFAASNSGERIQFPARTGFGETDGSGYGGTGQYIASRGPDGWTSKGITPTPALNDTLQLFYTFTYVFDFSEELDRAVVSGYDLPGVEGAKPDSENLYLEDTEASKLLATVTNASHEGEELNLPIFLLHPELGGSSANLGVVSFETYKNLVPEASGVVPKVYAYEHGAVKLVGVLPDGSIPSEGSVLVRGQVGNAVAAGAVERKDTVSRDGSRVLFMSPAFGERQLYMRKNGSTTVLVSESENSEAGAAQNVQFQGATPDGTKVLFTTETRLLKSDPGGPGAALYMYTDSPDPETESNLTFISRGVSTGGGEGNVVKGVSEDGSHVYYIDNGVLVLWDEGQAQQIAPEPGAPGAVQEEGEAHISSNGRQIAFMSHDGALVRGEDLASLPIGNTEIYVYDQESGKLACASCPQNGAAVTLGAELGVGATRGSVGFEIYAQPRFLSSDGRYVFFNTEEALVARDTNGVTDAYEYDTQTGKLALLSTGEGEDGTWFVEAGADGRDVFLVTRQQLTRSDPDKLADLYDARAGGGLPEPPVPKPPCAGDACQGTPSAAPSFNTASEFEGQGNPVFGSTGQVKPKTKAKPVTGRLARALAACRKQHAKRKRVRCEALARKRYGAHKAVKRTTTTTRTGR